MSKCRICSNPIVGRSDKKFCSVRCKNYYHTNLRRVTDGAVRSINSILHRNRSILLEVMGKNGTQRMVDRMVLERKRFNFGYHTHTRTNSAGRVYLYVYDFAWMAFSDEKVLVVRRMSTKHG